MNLNNFLGTQIYWLEFVKAPAAKNYIVEQSLSYLQTEGNSFAVSEAQIGNEVENAELVKLKKVFSMNFVIFER